MFRVAVAIFFLVTVSALAKPEGEERYRHTVLPILEEFCFDCHADGSDEGEVDFDGYAVIDSLLKDWDLWSRIDWQLASHVMPPAKKPSPSREQRDIIRRWIDEAVFFVDPERPDPGPVVVRRLSRAEYNRAIRDLLRVDLRPADSFPPDDAAHGFDHIGNSFSILWFEKHLGAGRDAAAAATRLRPVPQAGALIRDRQFQIYAGKAERKDQLVLLEDSESEVGTEISLPTAGLYRIKLRAASTKPGGEPARFEILDDGEPILELVSDHEYKGKRQYWDAAFALVELERGTRPFAVRLANPEPEGEKSPVAAIHTFAIQGPFAPVPPESTPFLDWLTGDGRALGIPVLGLSGEDFERGEGKSSLDPIGLGLESFDAIGRWQETENGAPIDAGGKLVTGEAFANFEELQRLLVETKRDAFVKNLAEQLLIYALGRGLEVEDKLAVGEIVRRCEEDGYRFQTMIRAICDSVPIQNMRTPQSR